MTVPSSPSPDVTILPVIIPPANSKPPSKILTGFFIAITLFFVAGFTAAGINIWAQTRPLKIGPEGPQGKPGATTTIYVTVTPTPQKSTSPPAIAFPKPTPKPQLTQNPTQKPRPTLSPKPKPTQTPSLNPPFTPHPIKTILCTVPVLC